MHYCTLMKSATGSKDSTGITTIIVPWQMKIEIDDVIDLIISKQGVPIPELILVKVRVRKTGELSGFVAWFDANQVIPMTEKATIKLLKKFRKYRGEKLPSSWP